VSVLFVVLPLAVLFSGLAVLAFSWATRQGQFDDLSTPALRVLRDDAGHASPAEIPEARAAVEGRRKTCSTGGELTPEAQDLRRLAAPRR